ncbi:hypothetical protein, partial [Pseudomonas brassicacearum]|uniref:hypothetical protein n=1 Tax=Pseudomonas brassicacearum TaxID=930166 RepID=UPI0011AF32A2
YVDSAAGSTDSFTLLKGLSTVEAIGLNNDVTLKDLKPYDSDSTPQTNIEPNNLANSIIVPPWARCSSWPWRRLAGCWP